MGDNKRLNEAIKLEPLILASASPRRAEILRAVGWQFSVRVADVDETLHAGEEPSDYVERLAQAKAMAVAKAIVNDEANNARLVLGADTTVVVDGDNLGKPRDREDARLMLSRLQGRWHEVLTGVALVAGERVSVSHKVTRVCFAEMTTREIAAYVATGEPMDKAGGYAVQGRAALFIKRIEGDYWNVVGLPMNLVYRLAQRI